MEKALVIESTGPELQAMFNRNDPDRAVIISHPHPLYGGNMDNPVVTAVEQAFAKAGFSTLRFNFRGTGSSTGRFDEGKGEQDDVRASFAWLEKHGYRDIMLAGYSFGAKINSLVVSKGCRVRDHIMVSPPVGFMSFDDIRKMPCTGLIVTGSDDTIAPPDLIQAHIRRWGINPVYRIISGCDHFYNGDGLLHLKSILTDYLSGMLTDF